VGARGAGGGGQTNGPGNGNMNLEAIGLSTRHFFAGRCKHPS